jgi:hypothetical protein
VARVEVLQPRDKVSSVEARVEERSNTSTVTLRVVGGDEKRSLQSETVKYGPEFHVGFCGGQVALG